MGMTDIERRALKGGTGFLANTGTLAAPVTLEPIALRLNDAVRVSGLSRSDLYRRAARGQIIFLKSGSRVLVEYASLKAAIADLPRAGINVNS